MHTINQDNYLVHPNDIGSKLRMLEITGQRLDANADENIHGMQVLAIGERAGRLLAEIGYPDGTVILFYRSKSGTSGKIQGTWYPIGGFMDREAWPYPNGWFIKDKGVHNRYGSNVFLATAQYLSRKEEEIF